MTDTQQPAGSPASASVVHHGHGNSIAAWTAVGTVIVGSIVTAAGVIATSWLVSVLGGVICIAGGVRQGAFGDGLWHCRPTRPALTEG